MTHPRFRLSPPLPRKARAEDRTSGILLSPLQVLTAVFAIGSEGKKNLSTMLVRHPGNAKVAHSGGRTWQSDLDFQVVFWRKLQPGGPSATVKSYTNSA